ncbi:hypothetical protein Tco_1035009, partial [Tanacetum coccineum]
DKNQVCLLCEVILKQIPAFNFFCASFESITAIEKLGKWVKGWKDTRELYLGLVGREKIALDKLAALAPQVILPPISNLSPCLLILVIQLEEEEAKTMAETMEQYMSQTRSDYGSGVVRPKIEDKDNIELKGQFLKELQTNTFSGSDHADANEHIGKVLEIVDLFHIPNITINQVMLRAFPMYLTRAASRWRRNKPIGSITT